MKQLFFAYEQTALVPPQFFSKNLSLLMPVQKNLIAARANHYNSYFASINLSFDDQLFHDVKELVEKKKQKKPVCMFIMGIGGSSLGTKAVYDVFSFAHNDFPLYFIETVDSTITHHYLQKMTSLLQAGSEVLLTVISKSGTTTETIANFECFLSVLQHERPTSYREFITVITDKGSKLERIAKQYNYTCLIIPTMVGGRYSVLSAVGLFPLLFTSLDVAQLREGARAQVHECIENSANAAGVSALIMAYHYKKGIRINDLFLFDPLLESIGKWYRQLLGESIGKEYNMAKKEVHCGITPTVSIGSTDLHSVGQLYLGGPYDRLTMFVSVQECATPVIIPVHQEFDKLVAHIQGKSLPDIMKAIIAGVEQAYTKGRRPFVKLVLPEKNEYGIGQFLQFKMIETMYLGTLLEVNPFDQPEVEWYKIYTKKILAHE